MPLSCQAYVYPASVPAEQPASCVFVVYNPSTTTPIAITGGSIVITELSDLDADENPYLVSVANNVLPLGQGMTTVVPPLSSIAVGPVPVVVHSSGAANSFQNVGPAGMLTAPQPASNRGDNLGTQFPQNTMLVGGTLYGSDGSINQVGWAPLLVDVVVPPPLGWQGGFLSLSAPSNLVTFLAGVL